jgi:hypothetical protein
MEGMLRRKILNAQQGIIIPGANVNTTGGKTGCRFSFGDQSDFETAFGKKRSSCQTRYTRSYDDYIVFDNTHSGFSIARIPR